jgi:hypothetical protein
MKSFAFGILLLSALTGAQAQSLKAQIASSDKTVDKLFLAKDMKGFATFMKAGVTSNFVYEEDGHSMSFDKMCQVMTMSFTRMQKVTQADSKTIDLLETGNTAVATTYHAMAAVMSGSDKKNHKLTYTGTSKDTYIKQGGKWKLSKMAWSNDKTLIDGKPLPSMSH